MLDGRPELRWLNVRKLCERLLPQNQLGTCFYFTAAKKERFQGDREPLFHEVYLRAIASTGVTVVRGYFRNHIRALPLAVREKRLVELIDPPLAPTILWERMMRQACVRAEPQRPRAMVVHTQEKRSDVSLASFLLRDGLSGNCQGALLLTNDGDFSIHSRYLRVVVLKCYWLPQRDVVALLTWHQLPLEFCKSRIQRSRRRNSCHNYTLDEGRRFRARRVGNKSPAQVRLERGARMSKHAGY